MSVQVYVDDRDPHVVYSDGWSQENNINTFHATDTFTTAAGSRATLNFRGTSISVFGTIPVKDSAFLPPLSSYSVDGGYPTSFQPQLGPDPQFKQQFYSSSSLAEGLHTLVITNTIANGLPLILDSFVIEQSPADGNTPMPIPPPATSASSSSPSFVSSTATSSSISASSSSTTTSTSTSTSITTTPLPSNSASPEDLTVTVTASPLTNSVSGVNSRQTLAAASNASSSSPNTGHITGGVVGTIVSLFLLGFAFAMWRKRQQNRAANMLFNSSPADPWRPPDSKGYIDPYPIASQYPNLSSPTGLAQTSDNRTSTLAEPQFPLPYGAYSANNNEYNRYNGYSNGAVGAQPQQQQGSPPNMPQTSNNRTSILANNFQPLFPGGYAPANSNPNRNSNQYGAIGTQPMDPQQEGSPSNMVLPSDNRNSTLPHDQAPQFPVPAIVVQPVHQGPYDGIVNDDFWHGMPAPSSQNDANGSGARTRINLD